MEIYQISQYLYILVAHLFLPNMNIYLNLLKRYFLKYKPFALKIYHIHLIYSSLNYPKLYSIVSSKSLLSASVSQAGRADVKETKEKREITVVNEDSGETRNYVIPYGSRIKVLDGTYLEAGDELTEGSVNPHDILRIKGAGAVQDYMMREVQRVYRLQGVDINDKHIEIIVRQMLKKVRIEEAGDSQYLPGALIDILELEDENERLLAEGKEPATAEQTLLGITKASLATSSFLSAASFQETTKVLTDAAIKGKIDPLIGLKENVLLGKLIPAGTGLKKYRNLHLDTGKVVNKIEEADEFDYDAASMEEEMRGQKSEDAAMMMDSENL